MDRGAHPRSAGDAVMRPHWEDPAALLRQADAVLRGMLPAWSAHFWAGGVAYRARFDYPGRVSVLDRNTGELIARSRPGRPTELAMRASAASIGAAPQRREW